MKIAPESEGRRAARPLRFLRLAGFALVAVAASSGVALAAKEVAVVTCTIAAGLGEAVMISTTVEGAPAEGGSCAEALLFFREAGLKLVSVDCPGGCVYTLSK
jgi:hypothetical protein